MTADRCALYQKEFMKCLDQASGDSSQCQGFWEAMKVSRIYFCFVTRVCLRLSLGMPTISRTICLVCIRFKKKQ